MLPNLATFEPVELEAARRLDLTCANLLSALHLPDSLCTFMSWRQAELYD